MKTKCINKLKLLFLSFFIISFFGACQFFKKNDGNNADLDKNVKKSYRKDGTLLATVHYKDSLRHGLARNYYTNGKVQLEINYVEGKKHGFATQYYENGDVYLKIPYENDMRNGIQLKYYEKNILMAEIPYRDNQLMPGLKEYDKQGKLITKPNKINFKLKDMTAFDNKLDLEMTLADGSKNAQFMVVSEPEQSGNQTDLYYVATKNGIGVETYYVLPGHAIKKTIHYKAERKTRLGHTEIHYETYLLNFTNMKRFD
ncbi:MAG: hypothetical protein KG029_18740 [Bacteroidetes bacterium]|nr:hypothetical protein [Bacteroidota bacterium]